MALTKPNFVAFKFFASCDIDSGPRDLAIFWLATSLLVHVLASYLFAFLTHENGEF